MRWHKNNLLQIALILVLLETAAQVYLTKFAGAERFLRYASLHQIEKHPIYGKPVSLVYSPHKYLGYYPTPNYRMGANQHNALGYRGDEDILQPKPRGEVRIVCLGGSTTYAARIEDYHKSYPYLLEKECQKRGHTNVRVINAGGGGWGSWEIFINFAFRVLDLQPSVIILYEGLNDVEQRLVWPPEAYKGDNSGAFLPRIERVEMPSIFEYSTLLRILMIRSGIIEPHSALKRTFIKLPPTFYGLEFLRQKSEGSYPSGIFKKVSAQEILKVNKPIYFKRNIENIVAIAKHNNIQTVLMTFASSPFSPDPQVSSEEYIDAIKETNNLLKKIGEDMNVHMFDFAAVFPKEQRYYIDGYHFSEEGAELMAKLLTQYLLQNDLM